MFQGVTEEELEPFLPLCDLVSVGRGSSTFKEGGAARFLYVVGQGRVALQMNLERPDGSVTGPTTVASVGTGDAFAWSAIVEPHRLTLSANAVEDCALVAIEAAALREILSRRRRVGYLVMMNVTKLLAERLSQTREAFVFERAWTLRQGTES